MPATDKTTIDVSNGQSALEENNIVVEETLGAENTVDEDLGDLGGDDEDEKHVDDPYAFINRSLHYQDMIMTQRHAKERLDFFEGFAKKMPAGKQPTKKLELYSQRVTAASERVDKFRVKYAKKRAEAKGRRAERVAAARAARENDKELSKPLKAAFAKARRAAEAAASKAAIEAVKALESDGNTSKKEQMDAGLKAYQLAHEEAFKSALEKAEFNESNSDAEEGVDKPPTPQQTEGAPEPVAA